MTTIDPYELMRALVALGDAHFATGDWRRDDSDESYETVWARITPAEAEVWRIVGLTRPDSVPTVNVTEETQ